MKVMNCALVVVLAAVLGGCAGGGGSGNKSQNEENAVIHEVTAADKETAKSKEPLRGSQALLYVNGLGCPLCATNVDKQLARVKGVSTIETDLSHGLVTVGLFGTAKPSAYELGEAVADAGFTLVKVETR